MYSKLKNFIDYFCNLFVGDSTDDDGERLETTSHYSVSYYDDSELESDIMIGNIE